MRRTQKPGAARALLVLALAACSADPRVETRALYTHVPAACALGESPYAIAYATGDFEPSGALAPATLLLTGRAAALDFPASTRAIAMEVTDESERPWRGLGAVPSSGDVSLLVLPYRGACALTGSVDARRGAAIGAAVGGRLLVAGGASLAGGVPPGMVANLATGGLAPLPAGLLVPRQGASVTAFGAGALVAGGATPGSRAAGAEAPIASAEVLGDRDFDGAPIALSAGRTEHAAVTAASGETVLLGGRGVTGVLGSIEVVDATARRARTEGLAALHAPRAGAHAVRLASGEILVVGGHDADGASVALLEWLTPDARGHARASFVLPDADAYDGVALQGGGALVVAASRAGPTVLRVDPAGGVTTGAPLEARMDDVRLFAGAADAPALWTGHAWLTWQPWRGALVALPGAQATGPAPGDPATTVDDGLAGWLAGTAINLFRFALRNRYASPTPTSPLLVTSTDGVVPDRLPDPFTFEATRGLSLPPGAGVTLADATFADLTLDFTVPNGVAPVVVLRADEGPETLASTASCPFGALAPGASLTLVRAGMVLSAGPRSGPLSVCSVRAPAAPARVAIGFRGVDAPSADGRATVRAVLVRRTPR